MTGREVDLAYREDRLVALYDVLNSGRADHAYYRRLSASLSGRVLEVGCGTGAAITFMARAGLELYGLDPAAGMLSVARHRDGGDLVSWHEGTIEQFGEDGPFEMIFMTGHVFQCLLQDNEITSFFKCCARLLSESGILAFETRNPALRPWERWVPEVSEVEVTSPTGERVKVWHDLVEVDDDKVTFIQHYAFQASRDVIRSASTLRFLDLDALCLFGQAAGLRLSWVHGDFEGKTFEKGDRELILGFKR